MADHYQSRGIQRGGYRVPPSAEPTSANHDASLCLQGRYPHQGGPMGWEILMSDEQVAFFYFRELFTANSSATRTPAITVEGRNPAARVPLPSNIPAGTSTTFTAVV